MKKLLVISCGVAVSLGLNADSTIVPKLSFADRFKSGAKTVSSGVKTGTKGVLKTASKVSDIVQPYAESAFKLGQTALEHKNAQTLGREQHQQTLESTRIGHQQNLEAMRVAQDHEFKMKQLDFEIEKMKMQHDPTAANALHDERSKEVQDFSDYMKRYNQMQQDEM